MRVQRQIIGGITDRVQDGRQLMNVPTASATSQARAIAAILGAEEVTTVDRLARKLSTVVSVDDVLSERTGDQVV